MLAQIFPRMFSSQNESESKTICFEHELPVLILQERNQFIGLGALREKASIPWTAHKIF